MGEQLKGEATAHREIKFRGLPALDREFIYGSYHSCIGDTDIRCAQYDSPPFVNKPVALNCHWILQHRLPTDNGWELRDSYQSYSVLPETVGQFTGLKDKNGIDIYEGDILKHKDPKGYTCENWEVIFYSGAFFMAGLPNKIRIYNLGDRLNTIEVIGNIYQNPELL